MTFQEGHTINVGKVGIKATAWKGGLRRTTQGYIMIRNPYQPTGYIMKHRLIMEELLGRRLLPEEVVHHINGIKDDNRMENLTLMDISEHQKGYHQLIFENQKLKQRISELERQSYIEDVYKPNIFVSL